MDHSRGRTTSPASVLASLMRPACSVGAIIAVLLCAIASPALGGSIKAPTVPCSLQVRDGHEAFFNAHAVGVQMYKATCLLEGGCLWGFVGPRADLYDKRGNVVGTHYPTQNGPTFPVWEENESHSRVVGSVVAGVTVDPMAIQWLLLEARDTFGPGPLEQTTFVQRVNTVGGLFPTTIPVMEGQTEDVPYTADYYFFRESQK